MTTRIQSITKDGIVEFPVDPDFRDFHAAVTISWGELRDGGWIDWTDPAWTWTSYDAEQKERLQERMDRRFWYRELSILPPDAWRRYFLDTLEGAMRIARPMYEAIAKSNGILVESDEYHKARDIASDFPATLLNGSSQDYASSGVDREWETVRERSLTDALEDAAERYRDPDDYVLRRLEVCFSQLVSVSINGY